MRLRSRLTSPVPALAPMMVAAAVLLAAPGCGGGAESAPAGPPPKVPVELAPPSLENGAFTLVENRDESTVKALVSKEESVLAADGRLWEIRDGQRLVGTLQLSTVKPKLDLLTADARESIVRQLMPGAVERLSVGDILVFKTASNDKIVYLWFGRTMYAVLQLKGSAIDPEAILNGIVAFQLQNPVGAEVLLREDELEDDEAA